MGRGDGVIESNTTDNGVVIVKTLMFSPLHTCHGVQYTCMARINDQSINLVNEIVMLLIYLFKVSIYFLVDYCHNGYYFCSAVR